MVRLLQKTIMSHAEKSEAGGKLCGEAGRKKRIQMERMKIVLLPGLLSSLRSLDVDNTERPVGSARFGGGSENAGLLVPRGSSLASTFRLRADSKSMHAD